MSQRRGSSSPAWCDCTRGTLVNVLCPECEKARRRIFDRRRHRKKRTGDANPGATLTPDQATSLLDTMEAINRLQLVITDRLARNGKQPQGDTAQLFRFLGTLRDALQPALAEPARERVEVRRDGRPKHYGEPV